MARERGAARALRRRLQAGSIERRFDRFDRAGRVAMPGRIVDPAPFATDGAIVVGVLSEPTPIGGNGRRVRRSGRGVGRQVFEARVRDDRHRLLEPSTRTRRAKPRAHANQQD